MFLFDLRWNTSEIIRNLLERGFRVILTRVDLKFFDGSFA